MKNVIIKHRNLLQKLKMVNYYIKNDSEISSDDSAEETDEE